MNSTTLAQPRLRVSRQSGFSQWSGSDHYLQVPQAGPSRISPQMNALDVPYDDDDQATPRVAMRPQLDSFADATPSQSGATGSERLRAILAKEHESLQTTRRSSPPRRRHESVSDVESDFESPHATAAQSQHVQSLRELFSKVNEDLTPRVRKPSRRRNSIDLSEVEDSPRVERVKEERAMHKGKRVSASDEEADMYTKSTDGSEISRHTSSAAKYGALQDKLDSSLRAPKFLQDPSRTTAFSRGPGMSGAEELLGLGPPTDMDMSAETSGDTAKLLRHFDRDPSGYTPVATSTPMRSLQMPSHFASQSNLLEQNSDMENAMKGLVSREESDISQRRLPFPPSKPNGRDPSPEPTSRAHGKSHSAHGLPLPRRVSSGGRESVSSRSSSTDFQNGQHDDNQDKFHERERQWNKPNGKSPAHPRTPETARRISQGSPSNSGAFPANGGSPSRQMLSRRSSSASMHNPHDGRMSMTSSISSQADYHERMADMDHDKNKERERMWNKPQARRSSSSLSFNSSGERSRASSSSSRAESAQGFNRMGGRPTSWHSPGSTQNFRIASPGSKDGVVELERERNWNSPQPKWEFQVPRAMSPLPPLSPVSGSGYGKPPPDWDPNKQYESPSRSRHASLTGVVGRRASYERSRTTSLSDEVGPSGSRTLLRRASTETKIGRGHSPAPSETGDEDRTKEAPSRFGWTFPRRRANLPPFEPDVDSPQRRPSTPESRPSSRLSTRGSLIPIRSPARRDEAPSSTRVRDEEGEQMKGHRRTPATFTESMGPVVSRSRIDPIDLMDVNIEDLAPTDIESGSDVESQVTSTPIAVPATLPTPRDPEPGPGPSSLSQAVTPSDEHDTSEYPDTFVTAASPELSPVRETPPEPIFGLSTPPRRPLLSTSRLEFETPSPPRNMPELPAPPSSSEEDDDIGATPFNARVSLLADFTAAKTPRPPGAWAATPAPAQVDKPVVAAPLLPPEAETPVPAPVNLTANNTLSAIPTPVPPGAWQTTPGSSMRRKSILKVRFDFDANTSGESMPEVPIIGPSDPADSISEVFPALLPSVASTSQAVVKRPVTSPLDEHEHASTPHAIRAARMRPKSPGLRLMDAFGREAPEVPSAPSIASSAKSDMVVPAPAPPPLPLDATPRSRSLVRIVDAMGREVDSEQSLDESSSSLPPPTSRGEALSRIRETLSKMADDLGESDDSRTVAAREDQRLRELHRASQAARSARREIAESLQKQRGDPSSSSAKGKLLAPVIRNSRFSIDFSNAWVLWCFILLQVVLSIYMYRLSTIRAKQIFLTTYYDAFTPDLFSHLSKTQSVQYAIPPASSPTPSPFSITDALTRDGWKAVLAEAWARSTVVITDFQNHIWDVWGQHPGRTHVWPPT